MKQASIPLCPSRAPSRTPPVVRLRLMCASWIGASLLAVVAGCATASSTAPSLDRASQLAEAGALFEAEKEVGEFLAKATTAQDRNRALLERGCIRLERGDARKALDDLGSVVETSARKEACTGRAYLLLAMPEDAYPHLKTAVELGANDEDVLQAVVLAAFSSNALEDAYKFASLAVEQYPSSPQIVVLWAQAQAVMGLLDDSLLALDECAKLTPDNPECPFVRANILWAAHRYDAAVNAYQKALELNPEFPDALRNMGVALLQSSRYEQAVQTLSKALDYFPEDVQLLNNLGVAQASLGRLAEAAQTYEQAAELAPQEAVLLNNMVDVYVRMGKIDQALQKVKKLVQLAPARANALRLLKDLVAMSVLMDTVCAPQKPKGGTVAAVEDAFVKEGWTKEEAAEALKQVLQDPTFSGAIEEKGKACP